jgi:hypothetical protein
MPNSVIGRFNWNAVKRLAGLRLSWQTLLVVRQ